MKIKTTDANLFDSNDEIIITSLLPVENGLYMVGSKKEKNYEVILIRVDASFDIQLRFRPCGRWNSLRR